MSLFVQTCNKTSASIPGKQRIKMGLRDIEHPSLVEMHQPESNGNAKAVYGYNEISSCRQADDDQAMADNVMARQEYPSFQEAEPCRRCAESGYPRENRYWQEVNPAFTFQSLNPTSLITTYQGAEHVSCRPRLRCSTDSDSWRSTSLRDSDTMSSTPSNFGDVSPWYASIALDDNEASQWTKCLPTTSPVPDTFQESLDHANRNFFNAPTDVSTMESSMAIDYGLLHGSYVVITPEPDVQGPYAYYSRFHNGSKISEPFMFEIPPDESRITVNEDIESFIKNLTEQQEPIGGQIFSRANGSENANIDNTITTDSNRFASDSSEQWQQSSPRSTTPSSSTDFNVVLRSSSAKDLTSLREYYDEATTSSDNMAPRRTSGEQRAADCQCTHEMDMFLIRSRRAGMSYKDIKLQGRFEVAESTLRGRFRTLTKEKQDRVRRPEWAPKDIELLKRAVLSYKAQNSWQDRQSGFGALSKQSASSSKIPWKKISDQIVSGGGSYHFGNATCRKKWDEIVKAEGKGRRH